MAKKKPVAKVRRPARDLVVIVSELRLLPVSIFLAVLAVVAMQSAGQLLPPRSSQPEFISSIAPSNLPQNVRAPDSPPKIAGPLLMPWRGPVEPVLGAATPAPVIYEVPTTDPVVFVTIDDGVTQTPEIADWLILHRLPFSLFLDNHAINTDYAYFGRLQSAGMAIQNHTLNHAYLPRLSLDEQKAEICGAADVFASVYGKRPRLFRPPYGAYSDTTRQAAQECGMQAIVMWRAFVDNGEVHFQTPKAHLESGDIVLLHFKPSLIRDIEVLTDEASKSHLRVGRLEDWLK